MNRPIEYRAWDTKANSWTEPHHIAIDGNGALMNAFSGEYLADQSRWIICRAIGLKDMHDIKIHDGDVLQYVTPHYGPDEKPEIYLVEWKNYGFEATWLNPRNPTSTNDGHLALRGADKDMVVIGNRFEDPELLEAKS